MQNLPDTMKVVAISEPGGPEVLILEQRALPDVGDGDILIRVEAAGVNRPDVLQRMGAYPPPKGASDLPGLEVAGEVVAVGAAVMGILRVTRLQLFARAEAMRSIVRCQRAMPCRCQLV
jgi:NADPH2:quinone reductase